MIELLRAKYEENLSSDGRLRCLNTKGVGWRWGGGGGEDEDSSHYLSRSIYFCFLEAKTKFENVCFKVFGSILRINLVVKSM